MKLQSLLQELTEVDLDPVAQVTGLTLNTQQIQAGSLFIALKGERQDGRHYIHEAIQKGAVAVLCEAEGLSEITLPTNPQVPVIAIKNLSEKLDILAKRYYQDPSQDLEITGITGTNGKTTSCYLLAQALCRLGISTGIIGTIGYGFVNQLIPCNLTTPDPISLQSYFSALKDKGAKSIAMEVSSHGLAQNRVKEVPFESAIFTNLTNDHLDYHQSMDAYGKAKQKLFQFSTLKRAIINADAAYAERIFNATVRGIDVLLYSLKPHPDLSSYKRSFVSFITVEDFSLEPKGIRATLKTPFGKGVLRSPLLGEFNLSNLLGVLSELCLRGIPLKEALSALSTALPAPGRMQRLGGVNGPQIIIDYAHTPDALENALKAARVHCRRRLWCVFGCGGDRDKGKRLTMGNMAGKHADKIVITSDNPRNEDPQQIIEEILRGVDIEFSHKTTIQENRHKAIEYAIHHALPIDTILIAGKGHENFQIIGDQKHPFNDAQCVKMVLGEKSDNEALNDSE